MSFKSDAVSTSNQAAVAPCKNWKIMMSKTGSIRVLIPFRKISQNNQTISSIIFIMHLIFYILLKKEDDLKTRGRYISQISQSKY